MLLEKGYKSFITVRVGGMGRKRKVNLEGCKVINIEAKDPLAGPLDFSFEKARESLKLGYFDTYRVFKNLSGQYYYINLEHQEDYFVDYFSNLDSDIILKVAQTLNLKDNIPHRRLLFERVVPKLVEVLKLSDECSYQDIAVALAEKIAMEVGVERFRIYSFAELIDSIIKKYGKHKKKTSTEENSLISHFGFLSLFTGDHVLKKLVQDLLDEKIIKLLKDEQESTR